MKKLLLILFIGLSLAGCDSDSGGGNNGGFGGNGGNKGGGNAPPVNNGAQINGMVNVSGTWSGPATINIGGQVTQCEKMTISFTQSATELTLVSGVITCGGQNNPLEGDTLAIQNGQLLENGNPTGTINGDTVAVQDGNDVLVMKKVGSKLTYIQNFTDDDGSQGQLSAELSQ